MYIETSSPRVNGDTAVLTTPLISGVIQDCTMTLWYHMYGTSIGSLKIEVQPSGTGTKTTLASFSGNKGNKWLQTSPLPLKKSTGDFVVG